MIQRYDLVVFGGSPSGVAAACAASERGSNVALFIEGKTVGGAISNGLGAADVGGTKSVTGFALRFFEKLRDLYPDAGATFDSPPSVTESIFREMLSEAGVTDIFENVEINFAKRDPNGISIIDTNVGTFDGFRYVDATYTGELLAAAGVPYRLGYEDYFSYGDDYTVREIIPLANVALKEADVLKSPYITEKFSPPDFEEVFFEGMPTMTYRVPLTNVKENLVKFAPTDNYSEYEGAFRAICLGFFDGSGDNVRNAQSGAFLSGLMQLSPTQDGKYDFNQGPINIMNVPIPLGVFGTKAEREAEFRKLEDYFRNWLYFISTDSSVPDNHRNSIGQFGLCADEFLDNNHWPYEPYIREGRRVVAKDTLLVENIYNPCLREAEQPIAIGNYALDSKASLSFVSDGVLYRDKGLHLNTPWYEVNRGCILAIGCPNLAVTVCYSASPRAHGSVRMEPQYMQIGESAGVLAHMSLTGHRHMEFVNQDDFITELASKDAYVQMSDLCHTIHPNFRASAGFGDNCELIEMDLH